MLWGSKGNPPGGGARRGILWALAKSIWHLRQQEGQQPLGRVPAKALMEGQENLPPEAQSCPSDGLSPPCQVTFVQCSVCAA